MIATRFIPITDPTRGRDRDGNFLVEIDDDHQNSTDRNLSDLINMSPIIHKSAGKKVVRISKGLAMKGGWGVKISEAKMMDLIHDASNFKSSIRVPRVHRSFQLLINQRYWQDSDLHWQGGIHRFIVMDFIYGKPLDSCWNDLPMDTKEDIARQTAEMIKEMQSIEFPQCGPIGGRPFQLESLKGCPDYSYGPISGNSEFETCFNHNLDVCKRLNKVPQDATPFDFKKFVITHQAISPRNLILDEDGKVWLVNWGHSGAFPPAFESVALARRGSFPDFNEMVLSLIPRFPEEEAKLSIMYGLTTASSA
ncbi:Aminoglycoside phosphotransferase [Penicillium angulare]|uniref:Aminoglycoside phosphotransferase n=1 Tax=Penicillium angulare TaxID=116970 RepID=A0A9W9EVR2_9EURO|nr:Aminoglycoside phosphotransferase [Penicillium angulare]